MTFEISFFKILKLKIMQKQILLSAVVLFIIVSSFSSFKDQEQRHHGQQSIKTVAEPNWIGLLETNTELEVLYSLVDCDNKKKLLLKYFNEMPTGQQIKYKINLKYTGYFLDEEKWKAVSPNQLTAGDCAVTDTSMFVLLPPNWDLERVTVSATLIEVSQQ